MKATREKKKKKKRKAGQNGIRQQESFQRRIPGLVDAIDSEECHQHQVLKC
jgi:hypothetical protein